MTGTNFFPFSGMDVDGVIDGGVLLDPLAFPFSFYYPSSAIGGTINFKEHSVQDDEQEPQALFLKNDGSKLYVLG